jgi:hypothetical protein
MEIGAVLQHAARALRIDEAFQPRLRQWVHAHDTATVLHAFLQRAQHPRVVGAGVLAHDDHELRGVDVLQRHRAFADADGLA